MNYSKLFVLGACGLTLASLPLRAQSAKPRAMPGVTKGPATVQMEKVGQIELPAGYLFLDGKTTRALMKKHGEPVSGREMGMLVATNENWSVMFEFADIGYVKDDDKNKLDADKLLASIKRGTAEANKERVRAGNPPLEVIGWEMPPKYDAASHNLEWAIRATSAGEPILNFNTRLLGSKGVMEVVLIVDPDKLPATLPTFRNLLAGYSFQTKQSYAEYRPGEKVAKYGLAGLIVGGGAVAAAKLGLLTGLLVFLKKGWKLVVVAFAAIAAFFKRLFSGRGARPQNQ